MRHIYFLVAALLLMSCTITASFLLAQEPKKEPGKSETETQKGDPKVVWTPEKVREIADLGDKCRAAHKAGNFKLAAECCERLCQLDTDPGDRYDLACFYVRLSRPDDAMRLLRDSIAQASNDPTLFLDELLREDEDIAPLRKRADFAGLLDKADAARWRATRLEYDSTIKKPAPFVRAKADNPYLTKLRADYRLETLVEGARGDLERVKILCAWVHTRWNHVGDAKDQPTEPIGLLEAAKRGDNFRCVEYGITVAGCLNAVGIPARVVGARSRDVENRRSGAGHVFAEAYLRDRKQWVFVDPQMNVVGELNGRPLNTVEFARELAAPRPKLTYHPMLASCLFYLVYDLGWRDPASSEKVETFMLIPKGSSAPRVFQRIHKQRFDRVTGNDADVYGPPAD